MLSFALNIAKSTKYLGHEAYSHSTVFIMLRISFYVAKLRNIHKKTSVLKSLLNKVGEQKDFIQHKRFPVNFAKFLRTLCDILRNLFYRTPLVAASNMSLIIDP